MFDKTLTTKNWTKRIPSTPQHALDDLVCFGRVNSSSSTIKTGRHNITEILLKVALSTNYQIKSIQTHVQQYIKYPRFYDILLHA
jgi:hypothetical protein